MASRAALDLDPAVGIAVGTRVDHGSPRPDLGELVRVLITFLLLSG